MAELFSDSPGITFISFSRLFALTGTFSRMFNGSGNSGFPLFVICPSFGDLRGRSLDGNECTGKCQKCSQALPIWMEWSEAGLD